MPDYNYSIFNKHFSVLPRKLSLGKKKMHDGPNKAGVKSDSQEAKQYSFWTITQTQQKPHHSFSIVDQNDRINQVN